MSQALASRCVLRSDRIGWSVCCHLRALLCPGLWAALIPSHLSCWAAGEAGADWGRLAHGRPLETLSLRPPPQGRYDEEIEVYRHHLEQMYKLCRPCQAAVEHYIKHQNRQLRALLLSRRFKRREADQTHTQVRGASVGHSGHPSP